MSWRCSAVQGLLLGLGLWFAAGLVHADPVDSTAAPAPPKAEPSTTQPGPVPPAPGDISKILQSIERMNLRNHTAGRKKPIRLNGRSGDMLGGKSMRGIAAEADPAHEKSGEPTSGRWRRVPLAKPQASAKPLTPEQAALIEQLESVGYLSGSELATQIGGVNLYDAERTAPGLNLYTSGHAPVAYLMDASGRLLHRWHIQFGDIWPDYPKSRITEDAGFFRRAYLQPNGDLYVIFEGYGLVKLDKDSKLLWKTSCRVHHDMDTLANGDLCVLTREAHMIERINEDRPILEDFLSVLDPNTGVERQRISIIEALENSKYASLWRHDDRPYGDIFHCNTVDVLEGYGANRIPAFAAGNVMVSIRNENIVAVVNLDAMKVLWAHKGPYVRQHDSKVLPTGNLLLFDNLSTGNRSAVLEFDPLTMRTVWELRDVGGQPFVSRTCGTAHRLPNGNTLVTASDSGHAFEVTPAQEVVWDFSNPHRAGKNNEFVATLFNVDRIAPDFPVDWVDAKTLE